MSRAPSAASGEKKRKRRGLSVMSPLQKAIAAAEDAARRAKEHEEEDEDEEQDEDYAVEENSEYDSESSSSQEENATCPDCWDELGGDPDEHDCPEDEQNNLKKHLTNAVQELLEEMVEVGFDEKHVRRCLRKLSRRKNLVQ